MVGWRSGWRRRCWFAMVLRPSRDGFGTAQAGRLRIALSDRASEPSRSVRSPRMEKWPPGPGVSAPRQASGWLEARRCGRRAALAVSATGRDAAEADRTARRGCVGHTVALPAPESSHCADVVGRPCQSKLFRLARSAALRPSRGSHDAGSPRRRRRCKPDRTPRPCWPAVGACVRLAHGTRAWASWASWASWPAFSRRCG